MLRMVLKDVELSSYNQLAITICICLVICVRIILVDEYIFTSPQLIINIYLSIFDGFKID